MNQLILSEQYLGRRISEEKNLWPSHFMFSVALLTAECEHKFIYNQLWQLLQIGLIQVPSSPKETIVTMLFLSQFQVYQHLQTWQVFPFFY